jgi:hypothetical protein
MYRESISIACCLFLAVACGQEQKGPDYRTDPGKDSSISIDLSPDSATRSVEAMADTLILQVDSTGRMAWQGKPLSGSDLATQLEDSLWNTYLRAGNLPAYLDIRYEGTVLMGLRGTLRDEVRQSQQVVANAISLKDLNSSYRSLDPKIQQEFRERYPILFQKDF